MRHHGLYERSLWLLRHLGRLQWKLSDTKSKPPLPPRPAPTSRPATILDFLPALFQTGGFSDVRATAGQAQGLSP
jgi:hypothetical protein